MAKKRIEMKTVAMLDGDDFSIFEVPTFISRKALVDDAPWRALIATKSTTSSGAAGYWSVWIDSRDVDGEYVAEGQWAGAWSSEAITDADKLKALRDEALKDFERTIRKARMESDPDYQRLRERYKLAEAV